MASTSLQLLDGPCPKPFLSQYDYPSTGGFVEGRMCFPIEMLNATCCIPCPVTDWVYADGFQQRTEVGNWVNLAAACATAFLLVSFIVLDVKWTHRHYLSVCLAIGVLLMEFSFILPLMTTPQQCHNEITPNGMRSDMSCAFSGACLLFGGWAVVVWVLWRALSIHLQICWEVVPGPKFFYSALVLGWGIPAAGLATTLSLTGVSYRFGNVCHINHNLGLQDFWGPLLAFAAVAMILQFVTIGYCIHVYLKSLLNHSSPRGKVNDLTSVQGSIGGNSARQTYKRVKRVVELQWRGASIVLVILGEVVFFSLVFVSMDSNSQINDKLREKATDWVICLIASAGDKTQCLPQTHKFVLSEPVVLAVLVCLALSGFWCLLFLGRWSMVLGWRDLFRRRFLRRADLASVDAYQVASKRDSYNMLDSPKSRPLHRVMSPLQSPVSPSMVGRTTPSVSEGAYANNYFGSFESTDNYGRAISTNIQPDGSTNNQRATEQHQLGVAITKDYA